jgi:hypothetical protein
MNILNDIQKQKGCFVNVSNQNNLIDAVNRLRKTCFDPKQFDVQNRSDGIFVRVRSSGTTTTTETEEYHLQGEVTQSNCSGLGGSIEIHGGLDIRKTNSEVYVTPLTTTTGTGEHYEDTANVTGITTSKYILAMVDDPLQPTSFDIYTSATYPDDDGNKYQKFVLGYANVTAGVLTWEPYWSGGDIISDTPAIPDANMETPDSKYLEFRPGDGRLQLLDFNNAASKTLVGKEANDLVYRATNVAAVTIGLAANAAGSADSISRSDHYHHVSAADNATHADVATYANTSGSVLTAHADLTDIVAGTAGDDHSGTNYNYVGNSGDYSRNNMTNGLGDSAGREVVNVNGLKLKTVSNAHYSVDWGSQYLQAYKFIGGNTYVSVDWQLASLRKSTGVTSSTTVNWDSCELQDGDPSTNHTTLDWDARQLAYSYWELTDTTEITDETYASGSFRVAGGLSCAKKVQATKFQLLGDKDCCFSTNALSAVVTDSIVLNSPVINYGTACSAGVTITNWITVGGVIGAGIAPVTIYANTGSSVVAMEILARI